MNDVQDERQQEMQLEREQLNAGWGGNDEDYTWQLDDNNWDEDPDEWDED